MAVGGHRTRTVRAVLAGVAGVSLLAATGCSGHRPHWDSPDREDVVRVEQTNAYWVVTMDGPQQTSEVLGCLRRGGPAGDFADVVWDGPTRFRVTTTTGGHADVQLDGPAGSDGYAVSSAALTHGSRDPDGEPFSCPDDLDS